MKKWKPKLNQAYWYISTTFWDVSYSKVEDYNFDKFNLHFGNCFKTEAEAQKVLNKIRGG